MHGKAIVRLAYVFCQQNGFAGAGNLGIPTRMVLHSGNTHAKSWKAVNVFSGVAPGVILAIFSKIRCVHSVTR